MATTTALLQALVSKTDGWLAGRFSGADSSDVARVLLSARAEREQLRARARAGMGVLHIDRLTPETAPTGEPGLGEPGLGVLSLGEPC